MSIYLLSQAGQQLKFTDNDGGGGTSSIGRKVENRSKRKVRPCEEGSFKSRPGCPQGAGKVVRAVKEKPNGKQTCYAQAIFLEREAASRKRLGFKEFIAKEKEKARTDRRENLPKCFT